MEVTNVQDHITHAVIGGEKTMDFGISNNAEFFQILSSSLYSNQILAVIREVMCNAWDAHIESNITDTPIKVTITNNEFVVRDYGTGIPKEDIQTVYGIYGESTKRKKGNVTGGFGLGCKAPFAYQEHFEVTSWNQQEQTIYAMCRSSSEANGKPGITPIVSMPTEESGLQVKVAIKPNDVSLFKKQIASVASNGEMLVSFEDQYNENNPSILPTVAYSKSKLGFTILTETEFNSVSLINLRYGNVIYPVTKEEGFKDEHEAALGKLRSLDSGYRSCFLILQAPPDSICVAPSREALSMQSKTIDTIKVLLNDFIKKMNSAAYTHQIYLAKTKIFNELLVTNKLSIEDFLSDDVFKKFKGMRTCLSSFEEVAMHTTSCLKGMLPDKYKKKLLSLVPHEHRGAAFTFLKYSQNYRVKEEWHYKEVVIKMTNFVRKVAPLTTQPMKFYQIGKYNRVDDRHGDVSFYHISLDKLFRKTFVLTCSPSTVKSRLDRWPESLANDVAIIQPIARTNPDLDNLRKALAARKDINFIDLTIKHAWEIIDNPTVVAKARPKGIVKLSKCLDNYLPKKGMDDLEEDDFITEPLFIFHISRSSERFNTDFTGGTENTFLRMFGHLGGICVTEPSYNSYLEKGALPLYEFMAKKAHAYLVCNKKMRRYVSINRTINKMENAVIPAILANGDLARHFGVYTEISKLDTFYLSVYNTLWPRYPILNEVKSFFEGGKENPIFGVIRDVFEKDILMKYLDYSAFSRLLSSVHPEKQAEKALAISILKTKLKV